MGLRLLEPDPYTTFRLSPLLPLESQRIRLTVGAPPGTQAVTYVLDGEPLATVAAPPWDYWWALTPGEHELVAQATLADGETQSTSPLPFAVASFAEPGSFYVPGR
jgi:hypothetical protein